MNNRLRINNMNMNNLNNLDDLIMNQGYMSQRTKSPNRVNPNMVPNQFYNNDQHHNINKLNSNRDMSPNKMIAKNKPLLGNNNIPGTNRLQPTNINTNFENNYQIQAPFIQSQNRYPYDIMKPNSNMMQQQQNNNGWKNIKSPRSPHLDMQNFNSNNLINKNCYNHSNKAAEFMAQSDGQFIYYCQTCAAKLAAQGFNVMKLQVNTIGSNNNLVQPQKKSKLQYKRRQIPQISSYKNNPVYESIIQFLKQIYTVQQYHYEQYQQLQKIDSHYQHQISMCNEFYQQLIEILSKMHNDHIQDLQKQFKKHSQMRDIYVNQIVQNLSTIDQIVNDLDQNFQTIVNKMTPEDLKFFNLALDQNRSKIKFFSNQVEQQKDMFNQIIDYKQQRLTQMIAQFQKSLISLWEQPKQVKPQKFNQPKNLPSNTNKPINIQNLPPKQFNNQHRQSSNLHFNVPVSSNNVLQPNNRENIKNQPDQKMNILQMHQNSQKPALVRDFQGKGACRQIFDDDEDEQNLAQQVSPKFKNI